MSSKPVYVVSDVHLGAVPPDRGVSLCRWLDHAGERASEVVVNGDLFDFWFEYGSVIPRGHTRVLGALAALVDAGVPVRFMGGNHDWWAGSYLREEIGLTVHRDPVTLDLAGRRTLLAHGDGLGRGDLGYKLLRLVLRGRLTRWAFRWLHPDVGARFARSVSVTATHDGSASEGERMRSRVLEGWARARLEADPTLGLVLLGHSHVSTVLEVAAGRFYVNTGDWINHRTYAVLARGAPPRLEEWPG